MAAVILHRPADLVVGFDMGGTIAVLREETMRQHTLRVYRGLGMIPARVPDAMILRTIAEVRRNFEGAAEAHRDRDAFWFGVNSVVLRSLLTNPDHRKYIAVYAERIHDAFLAKEAFMVCPVLLKSVRMLRTHGARAVITSNATHAEAIGLLNHLNITEEFDAIFTSDLLGSRKTERGFWRGVPPRLFANGYAESSRLLQVGNSLYSDGFAARYGWQVLLIDDEARYRPHSPNVRLNAQFTPEHAARVRKDLRERKILFMRTREQMHQRLAKCVKRALNA